MERVAVHRDGASCCSTCRSCSVVFTTVSGLRLIDSMPTRTKNSAHVRVIRRRLSTQPRVDSVAPAALHCQADHLLHALVAFVVVERHNLAVTIDAESEGVDWARHRARRDRGAPPIRCERRVIAVLVLQATQEALGALGFWGFDVERPERLHRRQRIGRVRLLLAPLRFPVEADSHPRVYAD